jgi:hypothetical protein
MAAEAINPTTTGRNPEKMPLINALSLWREIKWLVYATNKNDGMTTTSVHNIEPKIPKMGDANSGE